MIKILVPVDRTAASRTALPVANWLAREMHAEIVVLSVGEHPETPKESGEEEEQLQRIVDEAAAQLHDVRVQRRVRKSGDPVRGILDAIAENGIDLVVRQLTPVRRSRSWHRAPSPTTSCERASSR